MMSLRCKLGLASLLACLGLPLAPLRAEPLKDYTALDLHALAAPPELIASPEALLKYLLQPATSDEDKARLLFRWVTNNIEYDIDSYKSGIATPASLAEVLRTRKSMCGGYANLFAELARLAGLEVMSISGYVKGFSYQPGEPLGEVNHEWNAVRIDGQWRLIDSTWGAGSVDETGIYRRRFQPYYFLADPAQLGWTHWPAESKWRLLTQDVVGDEFAARVRPTPVFFMLGLHMPQEVRHTIPVTCHNWSLNLPLPESVLLTASLTQAGSLQEHATLVQRAEQGAKVLVSLPGAGEYRLHLYGRKKSEAGDSFDLLLSYRLLAPSLPTNSARLPESYVTFQAHRGELLQPLSYHLPEQQVQHFSLRLADAVEVAVVSGDGQWFKLQREGDLFSGDVLVSGATRVVGSFDESGKNFFSLLAFVGTPPGQVPAVPLCQ